MLLSIIIPAHNAEATLAEQLDALITQCRSVDCEIVVVDNCSTDSTSALVARYAEHHTNLRLVPAHERASAPYARNAGIAAARGHALAFCDSDDVVGPSWVPTMARALADHALVTGPLEVHSLNPPSLVFSRGSAIENSKGPPSFFHRFPFAHGCNLGVQRAIVDEVGGFDERFPQGQDIELCFRLWLAGTKVHFELDALVHYRFRVTRRARFRQAKLYGSVRPALFLEMKRAGVAVPSRLAGWRRWVWLARELPSLRDAARRANWCWVLATRLGQLKGCVRHRTLYL
jgi:glycosyltransferase involved in cell wall biosynthesis